MGLCSYFLIGFYFEKKFASDAAMKAFVITRIGDCGFFLGICRRVRPLRLGRLGPCSGPQPANPTVSTPYLTLVCVLLFVGAGGKSAQFPLYAWLPDAMEGPTPVTP